MANREPGFYWVSLKSGQWIVCEWAKHKAWYLPACMEPFYSDELEEIDERRIERPADPERVFYDHKPEGAK